MCGLAGELTLSFSVSVFAMRHWVKEVESFVRFPAGSGLEWVIGKSRQVCSPVLFQVPSGLDMAVLAVAGGISPLLVLSTGYSNDCNLLMISQYTARHSRHAVQHYWLYVGRRLHYLIPQWWWIFCLCSSCHRQRMGLGLPCSSLLAWLVSICIFLCSVLVVVWLFVHGVLWRCFDINSFNMVKSLLVLCVHFI